MPPSNHVHAFELFATFHRAPAGPYPAHTTFTVSMCRCGAYTIFPRANFTVCTWAFRTQFQVTAAAAGWREER